MSLFLVNFRGEIIAQGVFIVVLSQLIHMVQFVFTWANTKLEKEGRRAEVGQGLVEYALLIVFIGVLMMGVLMVVGPLVGNMFRTIYDAVIDAST